MFQIFDILFHYLMDSPVVVWKRSIIRTNQLANSQTMQSNISTIPFIFQHIPHDQRGFHHFSMGFPSFSIVFPSFFNGGSSIIFPLFFHHCSMVFHHFPWFFPMFSQVFDPPPPSNLRRSPPVSPPGWCPAWPTAGSLHRPSPGARAPGGGPPKQDIPKTWHLVKHRNSIEISWILFPWNMVNLSIVMFVPEGIQSNLVGGWAT